MKFYKQEIGSVFEAMRSSAEGLTSQEAEKRLAEK